MFNLGFMYISTKFATLNADTWRALYSKLIKCDLKQCERIQTAKSLKKKIRYALKYVLLMHVIQHDDF